MNSNHIEYRGEIFTVTEYNGVSVIMDEEGYYNASKICADNDKRFNNISNSNYWIEYTHELEGVHDFMQTPLVKDRRTLSNEIRGYYIHPKLVNFLCFHVNTRYAITVGEIMDAINERIHLKCSSLEDELDSLHDENDKLKHELESVKDELKTVKDDYDMLNEENTILHENAKNLTNNVNELKTRTVPKGTNDKLLRVLKITDNRFKVSADSYRKRFEYPIVKTFILASSMHVRKELTEDGIIDRLEFNDLDGFCSYIRNNYTVLAEC